MSVSYAFAEPKNVEIDWIIEGQPVISKSPTISETILDDSSINEEQIDNFLFSTNETNDDVVVDFITGSEYVIGNHEITIDSEEGQKLNQILIEQREINKDNFRHMINYLDRYSDGYVELAQALIDPVRQQNYLQSGVTRDYNINSNLEYFLIERGYDLTDLESIPNNAFSPTKYDAVRAAAAESANSGSGSTDLRELLPNYVSKDSKIMHDEMIRKLTEQTTNVYDSISSSKLEISVKQSPDLSNTINDNLFDNFQFVNTKFENTQHVIDILDKPETPLEINTLYEYQFLILITIFIGLIILGYLVYRKSKVTHPLNPVIISTPINYVENTNNMIQSSKELFANNSPKYAFEKFSQAIRYYYSNKLQINLDLTTYDILFELKKSHIDNFDDIQQWLLLCGQVEFVKHKSTEKEFLKALDSFSKSIS
tara:strand:+ start:879 stop:2159 length:1281 start_codon:yes stop_codon:yes gene_type:complete